MSTCHADHDVPAPTGALRLALAGNPNVGKSTFFNALTGARVKVANYSGVTVTRTVGNFTAAGVTAELEDLPGTYSMDPLSPDEAIAVDQLRSGDYDGVVLIIDATSAYRGVDLLAQLSVIDAPVLVVLNFATDLVRRGGALDPQALAQAAGVDVVAVDPRVPAEVTTLAERLVHPETWARPVFPTPADPTDRAGWASSVLTSAGFHDPKPDTRSRRLDGFLLHPVWGTIFFFVFMLAFFQVIFTVAAPIQGLIEDGFAVIQEAVAGLPGPDWLISVLADGIIGGVGGVLVFLPQIALLFLMISLMERSGYMARAAFLMDRVMSTVGLEGRAFVAMLSSLACAIPGIMATRSLPDARDRLVTMMTAPLMTCSARLPVYTLLISAYVPLHYQGLAMFGLYLLGAVAAMIAAKVFSLVTRGRQSLPFYMQLPTLRLPRAVDILRDMWQACWHFLRRVGGIILLLSLILWAALYFPTGDIETSFAASIGHFIQPIFEPLGFNWQVTLGLLTAMGAREMFVGTMSQVAPDLVLAPDVAGALLVYFALAMQCLSTLAVLRRESGSLRWPVLAFVYMTVLAWVAAFLVRLIIP